MAHQHQQPESGSLLGGAEMEQVPVYGQFSQRRQSTIPRKPIPPTVSVEALSRSEDTSKHTAPSDSGYSREQPVDDGTQHNGHLWAPGVWRSFPYRGAFAIFGCISCIIASIIVLVVSDGQATERWRLSPTVYLALFMTGTNMLARFAFHDGVKISWWYKALQGGTLRDLHVQWSHADGFWTALFAGRDFNLVTLASIAVTIMVIDQPLIQRASSVVSVTQTEQVNVQAAVAPEFPWGFTAYNAGRDRFVMTKPMVDIFNDFNGATPITSSSFSGCNDTCTGWIAAGGLAARCNSTTGPIIYQSTRNAANVSPFSVSFELAGQDPSTNRSSQIVVHVAYSNASTSNCAATRTERTCYLAPATFQYPVKITGRVLEINGDVLTRSQVSSFTPPPYGSYDGGGDYVYWTIGGIYVAANTLFASNATYHINDAVTWASLPDTLSNQFVSLPPSNFTAVNGAVSLDVANVCNTNWTDPTEYILTSLNNIALRTSLAAATFPYRNTSIPPAPQHLLMQQTTTINVFKSEYRFLIASTVLTTLFILFITPTFVGWWELGRSVTLNPLETAKAFDAPLLRGPGTNATLWELVPIVGARNAKWGETEVYTEGGGVRRQLRFADPVEVARPTKGVVYD